MLRTQNFGGRDPTDRGEKESNPGGSDPTEHATATSFLGLLNYYGKFLPHLSSTLAPSTAYRMALESRPRRSVPQRKAAFDIGGSSHTLRLKAETGSFV